MNARTGSTRLKGPGILALAFGRGEPPGSPLVNECLYLFQNFFRLGKRLCPESFVILETIRFVGGKTVKFDSQSLKIRIVGYVQARKQLDKVANVIDKRSFEVVF